MNHVLNKLGDRRPAPSRWGWGLAFALMAGLGGTAWYFVPHNSVSSVFAQTPEVPPQTRPSDAVQRALPLVTSAPALPAVGEHPSPVARDPFASAPKTNHPPIARPVPAGNDPFASAPVRPEPSPWARTAESTPAAAEQRPPMPFSRSAHETFRPSLPALDAIEAERRPGFPAPALPLQDMQVQPAQELQPPASQDLFAAPSVDNPATLTPPAAPAATTTTELFGQQPEPEPTISAPTEESNPFKLAPPIEQRMTVPETPESAGNPFAAPEVPTSSPPLPPIGEPVVEPTPSIFPTTPPVNQPEPVITPYQPSPSPFPPASSQFPQPLENTSRPLLTSPPATRVSSTEPALAEEQIYKVQPGDNYWTISKAFYGSGRYFGGLAQYNSHRIPSPEKMKPGMIVLIPDALVLHRKYPQLCGPDPTQIKPEEPFGFFVDAQGHPAFRVGEGDTLGSIAQKHLGRVTRAEQLYQLNKDRIRDPNNLKLGTILRLPPDASQVMQLP